MPQGPMKNTDMNNTVPEPDRSVEYQGFENVYSETNSRMPTVPYHKPAPLQDATVMTSNTTRAEVPKGTPNAR